MRLIWIAPECPYPANTGGRMGIWKRIINMCDDSDIYFFCIVDDDSERQYQTEIKKYCKEVHFYNRNKGFKTVLKSLMKPYMLVSRCNNQMIMDIEKKCEEINADYIIVDTPQMMGNISKKVLCENRIVLNQHNIEFQALENLSSTMTNKLKEMTYKFVSRQLRVYEDSLYKNANITLFTFVSSSDKEFFEKRYQLTNTLLVPVGADIEFQKNIPITHEISFISKLSYPANSDSALWFVENVWEKITDACDDAKLFLVGKDPSELLISKTLKYKNIEVTGLVDSVLPYYERSQLIIVPLLSGGGVKVKLLEALGHGKIVVTTKKGIEGTDFKNGVEIIEEDTAEGFARACIDVFEHPKKYEEIRQMAMEKMKEEYSWKGIVTMFHDKLIEGLLK